MFSHLSSRFLRFVFSCWICLVTPLAAQDTLSPTPNLQLPTPTPALAPLAVRLVGNIQEGATYTAQLKGTAVPNYGPTTITFELGSILPAYGTAVITEAGMLTYTPMPHFAGADIFSYKVRQGDRISADASIAITVTQRNDPPVAISRTYYLNDQKIAKAEFQLQAFDLEGDPLIFRIIQSPPANQGTITLDESTGRFRFTPVKGAKQAVVSFTFKAVEKNTAENPKPLESQLAFVTLVLGDGVAFFGDTHKNTVGQVQIPAGETIPIADRLTIEKVGAVRDLAVDRANRRLFILTDVGVWAYAINPLPTAEAPLALRHFPQLTGTHLAISLDSRTLFVAGPGKVKAVNIYPEAIYVNGESIWVPSYASRGTPGNFREYALTPADRPIAALGVHPSGDRLFVVLAGLDQKVAVNNDLLRSDVGNGTRADKLTDADIPSDFGYLTTLDITSPVYFSGPPPRSRIFSEPIDLKELIYHQPASAAASGSPSALAPAVAVGIRALAFTPDGNSAFLAAVGGQTARATPFGVLPTTDEGTGGIVVLDVRPLPPVSEPASNSAPADAASAPISYLGFIPSVNYGEKTATIRQEIRREGWRIVHPEVQLARSRFNSSAAVLDASLTSYNPYATLPAFTSFTRDSIVLGELERSFEDYGYMQAYFDLYPRDMVGASGIAINHIGNFGVITFQDTNNLGLLTLNPSDALEGYSPDAPPRFSVPESSFHLDPPDYFLATGTGKTINAFNAGLAGGASVSNYSWAYPQEPVFTGDGARLFIGMAGGTPRSTLENRVGYVDALNLQAARDSLDSSLYGGNPPPGYTAFSAGFFQSPRRAATHQAAAGDFDGDGISDQAEAFNRWNELRAITVGKKAALVDTKISNPDPAPQIVHNNPGSYGWPSPPLGNQLTDDAWGRAYLVPTSGIGYRLAAQAELPPLMFGAASRGALTAIERLGQLWHEVYLDLEASRPSFSPYLHYRPYFVVGVISAPGGGPLINEKGEALQYGHRNGFQVSFPYPSHDPTNRTFKDTPHDFVTSNTPSVPLALNDPFYDPSATALGPRNNSVENFEGFDALNAARLLRLIFRESIDGRFLATRIDLDPAVRYLLTEPALSDERYYPDHDYRDRVRALVTDIDFGSPRFNYRGTRNGPGDSSRRDHDTAFNVTFSSLSLEIVPGVPVVTAPPSGTDTGDQTTPPAPTSAPPSPPGRHNFTVILPPIPESLRGDIRIVLPAIEALADDPLGHSYYTVRKADGSALIIGKEYTLDEIFGEAGVPADGRLSLTLDVNPAAVQDWQLALELRYLGLGSVYSLRDRFEYIQWKPDHIVPSRLLVRPSGHPVSVDQVVSVRAEVFGFNRPIRYRAVRWVPLLDSTREPRLPQLDPESGEIVAGEDPGYLWVVASSETPEGKEVITEPLRFEIGQASPASADSVGEIDFTDENNNFVIRISDGAGGYLLLEAGDKGKDLFKAQGMSYPYANGGGAVLRDKHGRPRQVFNRHAFFDISAPDAKDAEAGPLSVDVYKMPATPGFRPDYDATTQLYELTALGTPVSQLSLTGTSALVTIQAKQDIGTSLETDHQHGYTKLSNQWGLAMHKGSGSNGA